MPLKRTNNDDGEVFEMNKLKNGEVGVTVNSFQPGRAVLCIGNEIERKKFLILDNYSTCDWYGHECTLKVRRLNKGEKITIEFT